MNRKNLEKILKSVANKRRLAILEYLEKQKEANVGEIAERINLSYKSTSRHLGTLVSADILEREQRSLEAYYSLTRDLPDFVKIIIRNL